MRVHPIRDALFVSSSAVSSAHGSTSLRRRNLLGVLRCAGFIIADFCLVHWCGLTEPRQVFGESLDGALAVIFVDNQFDYYYSIAHFNL
jgi:hypothetical protein